MGKWKVDSLSQLDEAGVSVLDARNPLGGGQIEAESKLNYRSNYERLFDPRPFAARSLAREIQTAEGICFPKVNARSQPIVFVLTWLERFAEQEPLADILVTTVIAEDKA